MHLLSLLAMLFNILSDWTVFFYDKVKEFFEVFHGIGGMRFDFSVATSPKERASFLNCEIHMFHKLGIVYSQFHFLEIISLGC
jgi:hypothetical protein